MKIYTKTGDDGTTGVQGGPRLPKTDSRIIAYGAVDEINAALGVSLTHAMAGDLSDVLANIQNELFVLGADLSNPDMKNSSNRVSQQMIDGMEETIDRFDEKLPLLTNFILPGGSALAASIHHARTITRRAEIHTLILKEKEEINPLCAVYLNRLSDLLFVLGRFANKQDGGSDVIWTPHDTK